MRAYAYADFAVTIDKFLWLNGKRPIPIYFVHLVYLCNSIKLFIELTDGICTVPIVPRFRLINGLKFTQPYAYLLSGT